MSEVRLIDANALKRYIPTRMDMQDLYLPVHFKTLIDEQPTVDAVAVCRCRDCKWWDMVDMVCGNDDVSRKINDCGCYPDFRTEPDWFCADGERR